MRAILQRVTEAKVVVDNKITGQIEQGLLVLIAFEDTDDLNDIQWITKKICEMRIFNDGNGKMNLSLLDINGELLIVSQFTLHASIKKGNSNNLV